MNLPSSPLENALNVAIGTFVLKGGKIKQSEVYSKDMSDFGVAKDILVSMSDKYV